MRVTVNVERSVKIGIDSMGKFVSCWPEGFYDTIRKKVITITVSNKSTELNGVTEYSTEMLFSRVMPLISARTTDIADVFAYELSPIPTSIFDDFCSHKTYSSSSERCCSR